LEGKTPSSKKRALATCWWVAGRKETWRRKGVGRGVVSNPGHGKRSEGVAKEFLKKIGERSRRENRKSRCGEYW